MGIFGIAFDRVQRRRSVFWRGVVQLEADKSCAD